LDEAEVKERWVGHKLGPRQNERN